MPRLAAYGFLTLQIALLLACIAPFRSLALTMDYTLSFAGGLGLAMCYTAVLSVAMAAFCLVAVPLLDSLAGIGALGYAIIVWSVTACSKLRALVRHQQAWSSSTPAVPADDIPAAGEPSLRLSSSTVSLGNH